MKASSKQGQFMKTSSGEVMTTNRGGYDSGKPSDLDFENLVTLYYRDLYRFARRMTRSDADASDLTQQTFYIWATKGHQLRDPANVKSWLFTTLRREFLQMLRRQSCFVSEDWTKAAEQSRPVSPDLVDRIDAGTVLRFLTQMDERFRSPIVLFFLEELSYKQIASVLGIPLGTVQSRIARAKAHLYQLLTQARKGADRRTSHAIASRPSTISNGQSKSVRDSRSSAGQNGSSLPSGETNKIVHHFTFENRRAA